ncbi:MAG TPA: radical SAM protein [Alphaproteobacteria bacterium]
MADAGADQIQFAGDDSLNGKVTISLPKAHPARARFRARFPMLYERFRLFRWKLKDLYLRMSGRGVFRRLAAAAEKPAHIEIETINKCNSTCGFCPVNRNSDPRKTMRMDEALFRRIIDELAAWDYRGTLNLFSNNEPFLDKRIYDFAAYARAKLPQAFVQIISNGTALDTAGAERILPSLSHMVINNYATEYKLHANVAAIIAHLETKRPELADKLVVGYRLLDEFKTNRAGNAPNRKVRAPHFASPCAYPFFQMVIRPDGKLSMCCNDALGEDTLGDVATEGVKGAWLNANRRSVQQAMLKGRHTIPLCAKCDNLAWSRPKRIAKAVASGNFTGA